MNNNSEQLLTQLYHDWCVRNNLPIDMCASEMLQDATAGDIVLNLQQVQWLVAFSNIWDLSDI